MLIKSIIIVAIIEFHFDLFYLTMKINLGITQPNLSILYRSTRSQMRVKWDIFNFNAVLRKHFGINPSLTYNFPLFNNNRKAYVIKQGKKKKILKLYKTGRVLDRLLHEHAALEFLKRSEFPVAKLLPALDGSTLIYRNRRFYAMFDYIDGVHPNGSHTQISPQNNRYYANVGKTLGSLHTALNGFRSELCLEQRVEVYPGYLYGMRDRFNKRIEFFRKITGDKKQTRISMENPLLNHFMLDYEQIKSTMKYLDKLFKDADPEFTHIHGDFTPNNLLVNNNNQIRVIDLEHTQLNWKIFDLSRFLNRLRNSTQNSNQNIENKIIEGYNTEFPITDKEAALIPYMRLHSRLYHLIGAVSRYYKYNDTHHLTDFKKQLAKAQIQISRIPELSDIQITVQ